MHYTPPTLTWEDGDTFVHLLTALSDFYVQATHISGAAFDGYLSLENDGSDDGVFIRNRYDARRDGLLPADEPGTFISFDNLKAINV